MENYIQLNKFQTPLESESIKKLPGDVYMDIIDYLENVEFVRNLISPSILTVKDLPKDSEGKIILWEQDEEENIVHDYITKPHILENMDFFRPAALHFKKHGKYTLLTPNPHPKSPYKQFWNEEVRRCREGYIRPDGEWIPGELYFYWNYCPIMLSREVKGTKKADRIQDFPDPWLGDYLWFHYMWAARNYGMHVGLIKSRGVGAEQPNSELVATPDGWKHVGDMSVGEDLIDSEGNPTKILEVLPQGVKDVYEIELIDGRKIRCGLDHLWLVHESLNGGKERILTTKQMLEEGIQKSFKAHNTWKFKVPRIQPVKYTKKDLLIPPYTLGFMLGDGSLNKSTPKVATDDVEVLDYILEELGDCYEMRRDNSNNNYLICRKDRFTYNNTDKKYENAQYGINPLIRDLAKLKLNVKCFDKFIPEIYKYGSVEQRLELLKGLMDSDGSINEAGKSEFTNSNLTLIEDVAELCRSLGIRCTIGEGRGPREKVIKGKKCKTKQEYRLYISTNLSIFKIKRKVIRESYNKSIFQNTPIVNIKKLDYKEESTCFIVNNPKHVYVTKDYTLTHNSFKGGAKGPYRALFFKKQKTFYVAYEKEFLTKDGILNKAWEYMDFLAQNTPFPRMRLTSSLNRMVMRIGYKDMEDGSERGTLGEIIGISTKDDPDKPRGKRGSILFEEFGKYPKITDTWNICRPSVEDGDFAFDQITAQGTGGSEGADFQGAEDMMYNPITYKILGLPNVFDKNVQGGKSIFHWGSYLSRKGCIDSNGMPDVVKALKEVCLEFYKIKQSSTDGKALTQRRAELAITIRDAIMRVDGTIFPVADIKDYLDEILTKGESFYETHYHGELVSDSSGIIKWEPTDKKPLRKYRYDVKRKEGAVEIFEMPKKDSTGVIDNRYICGNDPYDDDIGTSLGNIWVFDTWTQSIVAEYTGRPAFANEFYEVCRRLAVFYNAKIMYENNKKGLFTYFDQNNCLYLLADAPQILLDKEMLKSIGYGNRSKGVHATKEINSYARSRIRDWLLTEAHYSFQEFKDDEQITFKKNLHTIRSAALLEELIMWNPDGNFDRVSGLGMVMIYNEEKKKYLQSYKDNKKETNEFTSDDYFSANFDNRFSYNLASEEF